jgi:hypothetical protein
MTSRHHFNLNRVGNAVHGASGSRSTAYQFLRRPVGAAQQT